MNVWIWGIFGGMMEQTDESKSNLKSEENYYAFFFIKRFFDCIIGLMGLAVFCVLAIFLSPFYLFGDNKGPILYCQKRVGLNGKIFGMYKFRSMKVNAENILLKNKALYEEYVKNDYKLPPEKDPRMTKVGAFLRKSSLDEFPQFINVLKGDMSVVGPRPIVSKELNEYGSRKKDFIKMKPGITGIWSTSGRSTVGYPERCNLELEYNNHHSLYFDMHLIFKTMLKVLMKDGAY